MASVDQTTRALPTGQVITRGFAAAHGALAGALYLALLHAPLQVVGALQQAAQREVFVPGQDFDPGQLALVLLLAGVSFLLALAVFFLFPLIQGGVLGQVRDRLDYPDQPPRSFKAYGRAHYARLLGSQALFLLIMLAVMVPVMALTVGLAMQAWALSPEAPEPGQLDRQFLLYPAVLAAMAVAAVVMAAAGMVYWVANCVVVAERENAVAAWRKSLTFCRENFRGVLTLWLVNLAAGVVVAPLGLLGQLGIVTAWWALAALAVLHSAVIGYWGVVLAGLCMSMYLDRRTASVWRE